MFGRLVSCLIFLSKTTQPPSRLDVKHIVEGGYSRGYSWGYIRLAVRLRRVVDK